MPFDDVLVTSVPAKDVELVREFMPGARIELDPLSPEMASRHADARVLACMVHDPVDADALDALAGLEGLVTRSAGFDHLPLEELADRGVVACNLDGYATDAVAHLTISMLIALLRRVPEAMAETQGRARGGSGDPGWRRDHLVGRSLTEVTVGVLGVGRIGSRVARLASTMGASVVGHDVEPDPRMDLVPRFSWADSFEDLVGRSDALSLHVPLTDVTRGLISGDVIGRMPDGAVLVNTARGDVVDQAAVANALATGRLAGYAADVMPGEPAPKENHRFERFTNVVLTPHLGAYDNATIRSRYRHTAAACRAILDGDTATLGVYRVP